MAQWRSGAVAQWRSGAVAQWRSGAVAQWRSGAVAQWRSGAVAQWRSARVSVSALQEPGFNSSAAVSNRKIRSLYISPSSLSVINVYLAIDSREPLFASCLRALIAAWLEASHRSRDGVHSTGCIVVICETP